MYSDCDATSVTLHIQIRGGQTKDLTHSQNYELPIEFEIVSFIWLFSPQKSDDTFQQRVTSAKQGLECTCIV